MGHKQIGFGISTTAVAAIIAVSAMTWPTIDQALGVGLIVACLIVLVAGLIIAWWPSRRSAVPDKPSGRLSVGIKAENVGKLSVKGSRFVGLDVGVEANDCGEVDSDDNEFISPEDAQNGSDGQGRSNGQKYFDAARRQKEERKKSDD